MRIGLFGGTFDPPHEAHLSACLLAKKRLKLDQVWWLVTPGNPLKDTRGLAPLDDRIAAARGLARHPRIVVSGIEASIGLRYTHDTIRYLIAHCGGVRFVWLMGADNLRSFHRWQRWRDIAALIPIAVVDRMGPSLYATAGTAAQALAAARIPEQAALSLPERRPPVWVFLHGLKSPLSSTALRAERQSHARRPTGRKKAAKPAGATAATGETSTSRRTPTSARKPDQRPAAKAAKRKAKTRAPAKSKTHPAAAKRKAGKTAGRTTKKPRRTKTAHRGRQKG